ncbi:MAG: type 1 glutamine amidotransferase [Gammaproteobacteria bacterium]|uniref:gamma-glutamyl-gamma-aminobutyrate hydrolase family protein n=1 Tax=Pseudomaricurvus alcaniphilus TaxID=1166482 RepID=UPI00140D7A2F|nr:type 1 glutamine amidotransferase [Pseudomaricurvus alcaniphilus]MBR9912447.1 type 1 glutamine amidotransferase [Gammaproteobacteria bacterium]NHN37388.1 type 1 glutamine amidotransferase [Pseudomaricurvus alcaniphilus]
MRPLIAVTGPHRRLRFGWWATRLMLLLCGLRGVYVSSGRAQLSQPVRGVIIGGGDDIEPQHYGESGDAGVTYDPERDALEMDIIRRALAARVPIMGICRGAQLLNVVLGGNLWRDIRPLRKRTPNYNTARPVKWVELAGTSRLAAFLHQQPETMPGSSPHSADHHSARNVRLKVNSLHSQAINRLGEGLQCIGRDADGFIQAVEAERQFILGVQWHPEYLPYKRTQRLLFAHFASAVRKTPEKLLPDAGQGGADES